MSLLYWKLEGAKKETIFEVMVLAILDDCRERRSRKGKDIC